MEIIYLFKVVLKYRKGLWRKIEIRGNHALGDFDEIIREAFNYDPRDHLSMFFSGRAWKSKDYGQIEPDVKGSGIKTLINQLGLSEGDKMEYVYDFGDDIQHVITLERIKESEIKSQTPCIIAKSRTRLKYCKQCKNGGKKVKAKWQCIECLESTGELIYLCDDCHEKDHMEHYSIEIL